MGLLDKLFGSKNKETAAVDTGPCPHATLVPRWDSAQDMGDFDKATGFSCEQCGEHFTPEEARAMRSGS